MRVISSCWLRPCPLYTPPVAPTDWVIRWIIRTAAVFSSWILLWKVWWTLSLRGRRSRNKVSVGEPAEGSFARIPKRYSFLGPNDCLIPRFYPPSLRYHVVHFWVFYILNLQIDDLLNLVFFAAVNVLARVVMKDVANCDTHCELRNSVNQQIVERMRCLDLG